MRSLPGEATTPTSRACVAWPSNPVEGDPKLQPPVVQDAAVVAQPGSPPPPPAWKWREAKELTVWGWTLSRSGLLAS